MYLLRLVLIICAIVGLTTACGIKKINGTDSWDLGVISFGGNLKDPMRLQYRSWGYLGSQEPESWNWAPVSEVEAESLASSSGLRPGDFIIKTNGHPVSVSCSKFLGLHCSAKGLKLISVHPVDSVTSRYNPSFMILIPKGTSSLTVLRGGVGFRKGQVQVKAGGTGNYFSGYQKEFELTGGKEIQLRVRYPQAKNPIKTYEKGQGVPQSDKKAAYGYDKVVKVQTKVVDTSPPKIDIASDIEVASDKAIIRGIVSDDGEVQQVTVEGRVVNLTSSGRFNFSRYVPPKGEQITIEAVDEWGNRSSKKVTISRVVVDNSHVVTFANLDPTRLNGRSNRNAVALIIGIADYKRAPDAVYADNDAGVFSDYAQRALGISRNNIKTLTNRDASRTDMLSAIKRWLRGRIEEGETDVYMFYAGHGLASSDGQDLYLLPYDGEPDLLEDTSLKRNELFEVIAKAHPRSTTVFLDTCYSGVGRSEQTLLASARPIVLSPVRQAAPSGFTVFSAASGQQISSGLDEAKHGLFSYYLMKGMEGPADANSNREITVGELHTYVRKNVKQQSIRLGHLQVPELQGDANRILVAW